jgi:hypothetical protein
MTPESRKFIVRQRLDTHLPTNARNNTTTVLSVVRAARVATQRCGKHIYAAVHQHARIEEAVFSVGDAPRLYNDDLWQLQLELRESPELAE